MGTVSEYQNICRICLEGELLVSIFSPTTFLIRPVEMLEKLNILKIESNDSLPPLLCQSCLYRLLDAYNLQQLADASERRLREFFGQTSTIATTSNLNINSTELTNAEFIKADAECSSASMYANICDMFERHEVTTDIKEVAAGADDVELLNDVEIDVSSLTRSEAEDASLNNAFIPNKTKVHEAPLFTKILQEQSNFSNDEEQTASVKLKQKEISKNPLKVPDTCLECGKVFHYKGYLEIHKRVHTGERPFKCEICSRRFLTSTKLLVHQRTHKSTSNIQSDLLQETSTTNSDGKRFQCEICSAFLTTSSNLKSHKFTHISEREYQCEQCLAAFKSPRDVRRHEKVHETYKDNNCTLCDKSFTRVTSLKYHVQQVHRGIRKHKCSECGKTFGKRWNLTLHVRAHRGEKPFECSVCSTKFTRSTSLKKHMKLHS